MAKGIDLYTPAATRATYERLFSLAGSCLEAGFPVVLDAAFLQSEADLEVLEKLSAHVEPLTPDETGMIMPEPAARGC